MANVAWIRADDRRRGFKRRIQWCTFTVRAPRWLRTTSSLIFRNTHGYTYSPCTGARNAGSTVRFAVMLVTPNRWPLGMKSWLKYIDTDPCDASLHPLSIPTTQNTRQSIPVHDCPTKTNASYVSRFYTEHTHAHRSSDLFRLFLILFTLRRTFFCAVAVNRRGSFFFFNHTKFPRSVRGRVHA